jgi:amino acid transporter
MTIKELGVLNRFHVPARAMTVDLIVNVGLVIFITSNLAILYMSNIGYVLCHVFALSAFLLLRRDRPEWPRPIKVGAIWLPIAALLCALNAVFLLVGALAPRLAGAVLLPSHRAGQGERALERAHAERARCQGARRAVGAFGSSAGLRR